VSLRKVNEMIKNYCVLRPVRVQGSKTVIRLHISPVALYRTSRVLLNTIGLLPRHILPSTGTDLVGTNWPPKMANPLYQTVTHVDSLSPTLRTKNGRLCNNLRQKKKHINETKDRTMLIQKNVHILIYDGKLNTKS
jgi:hypothetical protein